MRIGIDAWGLSGTLVYTGVGQYVRHLIAGLGTLDTPPSLIAYGSPNEPRPEWLAESVEWRAPGAVGGRRLSALTSRALLLRLQIRNDQLDVFHVPGVHVRPSLPSVAAVSCPLVVTVHDLIPLTYYADALPTRIKVFYRWNLARGLRAQAIVTVSGSARAEILAHAPSAEDRLTVIPNGVDFAPHHDREPLRRLDIGPDFILYAGSYEPRKNLIRTLSAYARLVNNGFPQELVVIAEAASGHAERVHDHVETLGLANRVRFVHSLSERDLRALYTHAGVVCFPSLAEGFGFPPLQAAACRTPVVASDIPPIRETLGPDAEYVDPESVESVAAGLSRALSGEGRQSLVVARAFERARQFSWERSARAHLQVYESIASPPSARQ